MTEDAKGKFEYFNTEFHFQSRQQNPTLYHTILYNGNVLVHVCLNTQK